MPLVNMKEMMSGFRAKHGPGTERCRYVLYKVCVCVRCFGWKSLVMVVLELDAGTNSGTRRI